MARNLARQLSVFATGAPVRFGDRAEIEAILDRARRESVRRADPGREVVQSQLFQTK